MPLSLLSQGSFFTLNNTYLLHVHKTNLNIIQKQKIQMLFFFHKSFFFHHNL